MSLDVYLYTEQPQRKERGSGIFIRENGQTKEISEQEWNERNPGREAVKFQTEEMETNRVYTDNITHNLGQMAAQAGIYEALWRPEELGITKAKDLISKLEAGLFILKNHSDNFKTFNPENGWGNYEGLVGFVENYLTACVGNPEAEIRVSR